MPETIIPEPVVARRDVARRNRRLVGTVLAVIAIGLVLQVWSTGTFDNFLWRVGLNSKPCATNGFGATFCGDQLDQYNKRIGNP